MNRKSLKQDVKLPLKDLADTLTVNDIATIIMLQAHRDNINCRIGTFRGKDVEKEAKRKMSYTLDEVITNINQNSQGFLIRKQFSNDSETVMENIGSLIELVNNKDVDIKRKYLQLDHYATDFLVAAKMLEINGPVDDFYKQTLKATEKLISFMEIYAYDNDCYHYDRVNENLINLLIKELYPQSNKTLEA